MGDVAILLAALVLDALLGDPPGLWRRVPHPVRLCGWLIAGAERWLNRPGWTASTRRAAGAGTVLALLAVAGGLGMGLAMLAAALPGGAALEVALVWVLLAARGLHDHVLAVARGFESGGLSAARRAVAHIVGRDPESLDAGGVSRAAIESAAENFADGVVAPAFWYLLGGLPGLFAYKALNTADSMIGHRDPRHLAFGQAAARLDDVANLAPARLAGALIALAAGFGGGPGAVRRAGRAMWRDAGRHRSPNAGWPEAAMAGALRVRLAGPRQYGGERVEDAWMGEGGGPAGPGDIRRALAVMVRASLLLWALLWLGPAAGWLAAG